MSARVARAERSKLLRQHRSALLTTHVLKASRNEAHLPWCFQKSKSERTASRCEIPFDVSHLGILGAEVVMEHEATACIVLGTLLQAW